MKWFRIPKDTATPTTQTEYGGWKEELRIEAKEQCVYCAIHESAFGGLRNFAVEHLRPKSKFPKLTLDYRNLFYVCSMCNSFKGDDWPTNKPRPAVACYLDPADHDYGEHFLVINNTGLARGKTVAARYIVQRLHLNRNQLILFRRSRLLIERARRFIEYAKQAKDIRDVPTFQRLLDAVIRIETAERTLILATPYEADDTRA